VLTLLTLLAIPHLCDLELLLYTSQFLAVARFKTI